MMGMDPEILSTGPPFSEFFAWNLCSRVVRMKEKKNKLSDNESLEMAQCSAYVPITRKSMQGTIES